MGMTKYSRFIDCSTAQDGSDVRTIDVIDTDDYNPKPAWYTDDASFLEKLFSPQLVAEWKAANQWFVQVPSDVDPGAVLKGAHTDPTAYTNPDGTDGAGAMPVQVVAEPPIVNANSP